MKNRSIFALAAALGVALTFTFSCSSDDNGDNQPAKDGEKEYNYCVFIEQQICLTGSFTSCDVGHPSNECPYGNNSNNQSN